MTNAELREALDRLREVDSEAADVIEDALLAAAELVVWKTLAIRLAKVVAVYQTMSPN